MPLPQKSDYFASVVSWLQTQGPVCWLDGSNSGHRESTVSYIAGLPRQSLEIREGEIIHKMGAEYHSHKSDQVFQWLAQFFNEQRCWLFGYLGYDLKNQVENLSSANHDPVQAPDAFIFEPGLLIRYEHKTGEISVLRGALPELVPEYPEQTFEFGTWRSQISKDEYISAIEACKYHIHEGDCYEINLSRQIWAEFSGSGLSAYLHIREQNETPFGAYLNTGDYEILSFSPERFLKRRGEMLESHPIKGTRKRGANAREDAALISELKHSIKEQAENLMIVDLVRHDLSRVCRPGSVSVSRLFDIQTFPKVHQMVSVVEGILEGHVNPFDILAHTFPMGSMTGAPKVRVMQLIEQIENYRRGIYSGCLGYFTPEGNFDLNVIIRSIIIGNQKAFYATGGAITADSDPSQEWEETIIKTSTLSKISNSELINPHA